MAFVSLLAQANAIVFTVAKRGHRIANHVIHSGLTMYRGCHWPFEQEVSRSFVLLLVLSGRTLFSHKPFSFHHAGYSSSYRGLKLTSALMKIENGLSSGSLISTSQPFLHEMLSLRFEHSLRSSFAAHLTAPTPSRSRLAAVGKPRPKMFCQAMLGLQNSASLASGMGSIFVLKRDVDTVYEDV